MSDLLVAKKLSNKQLAPVVNLQAVADLVTACKTNQLFEGKPE